MHPHYDDVVSDVHRFLAERMFACQMAGIDKKRILVDPGFGFGKTLEHNLALLRALDQFAALGAPLMVGLSRKAMIGTLTGRERRCGSCRWFRRRGADRRATRGNDRACARCGSDARCAGGMAGRGVRHRAGQTGVEAVWIAALRGRLGSCRTRPVIGMRECPSIFKTTLQNVSGTCSVFFWADMRFPSPSLAIE